MLRGTVKSWNDDEGWGVLVSPEAASEIWAHFSHIEADGYRTLATGAAVFFDYERVPGGQDGYEFPATRILSAQD
jgi:CspA family cold shock protein